MNFDSIYDVWTEFINDIKYKKYFVSNEDIWYERFSKVKQYIDTYNKKPSTNRDENDDIKQLGLWTATQQTNYRIKTNIMSNQYIYNKWTEFISDSKYKNYFLSNEDIWYDYLNKVKQYIDTYKKRPSAHDKNDDIKQIGLWTATQQTNYKKKTKIMSNQEIYDTIFLHKT